MLRLTASVLVLLSASAGASGVDLARQYPATLDYQQDAPARDWTCEPGAGNQPVIPMRRSIVIDAQTVEGPRRFFMADTDAGTVKYEPDFQNRALPPLMPITPEDALAAFDAAWQAFDREYAMFSIRDVDWLQARKRHRPAAAKARTSYEAAAAIAALLAQLEDLHAWVRLGKEFVQGYSRPRPLNGNFHACTALLSGLRRTKRDMAWARTNDDIGYVNVYQLSDQKLPDAFDDALGRPADTWALVLDLRFNGGGDELLGHALAGRFLDQQRVYSYNHYRAGPKHDALGPAWRVSAARAAHGATNRR